MSRNSEVEKGVIILKGDINHTVTSKKPNFTHTLSNYKNRILYLGTETLYLGKLYNWLDYLKELRNKGID